MPDHATPRADNTILVILGVSVAAIIGIAVILFFGIAHGEARLAEEARAREALEALQRTSKVVLIGSSTIARFPADAFGPGAVLNLGVPNETSVQIRARLREWKPPFAPRGAVLYLGSSDHNFDPTLSPAEIRKRVEAVVDDLLARFPDPPMSGIVLVEILPARHQSQAERESLEAINRELADIAAAHHPRVKLLQTNRPPLVDQDGSLSEAMSVDRHHLNAAGYEVLSRWIVEDGGAVSDHLR